MSSFLPELSQLAAKRVALKPTETRVRTIGFVVDTEPDLQLGRVIEPQKGVSATAHAQLGPSLAVSIGTGGLFVSSQDVAADKDMLRREGVHVVLNVAWHDRDTNDSGVQHVSASEQQTYELRYEGGSETPSYLSAPILDIDTIEEERIASWLRTCLAHIHHHRHQGRTVLVHCNAGISRSTTVCIAYLMATQNITFEEALQRVKRARPRTQPNRGFIQYLNTVSNPASLLQPQ